MGGCYEFTSSKGATSSRLKKMRPSCPRVARKLATLGFVAQSLWDWNTLPTQITFAPPRTAESARVCLIFSAAPPVNWFV